MTHGLSRTTALRAIALLACAMLFLVSPGAAHAGASLSGPLQLIPGWLQEAIDSYERTLVMSLRETARVGGALLWDILRVCGLVGLFGDDFTALLGTVATEALNAVITGSAPCTV